MAELLRRVNAPSNLLEQFEECGVDGRRDFHVLAHFVEGWQARELLQCGLGLDTHNFEVVMDLLAGVRSSELVSVCCLDADIR